MSTASSNSRRSSGPVLRSLSPRGRFPSPAQTNPSLSCTAPYYSSSSSCSSSSSAFASSTTFSFSSPPTAFFSAGPHRSASPTRVNLYTTPSPHSPTFRCSLDRSIVVSKPNNTHPVSFPKKTCMCSPTTHPGSFRCSLHKKHANGFASGSSLSVSYTPNRLNMMRSAMKNSLVRIGGVEGEWVKRALTALIRPSSHQQRRRADFQPRPSRLSVMSLAADP